MHKTTGWGIAGVVVVLLSVTWVWMGRDRPGALPEQDRTDSHGPAIRRDGTIGEHVIAPKDSPTGVRPDPSFATTAASGPVHPLLGEAREVVLMEGGDAVRSPPRPELAEVIRAVSQAGRRGDDLALLVIDDPQNESIFPPEIVAPAFLWHEPAAEADTWLIEAVFGNGAPPLYVLVPGRPLPAGPVDPECITENNEVYRPTPYQASARSWSPGDEVWAEVKRQSTGLAAEITILGFRSAEPHQALSRGHVTLTTSTDPVAAPIFYRDVPLAPSATQEGVIKPLGEEAVTLIAWRLRDISQPQSRLLLSGVPTCTNCHSFSLDGKTMGMDLDGPQGDKGAYVIAPLAPQTAISQRDVISWNSFPDQPKNHKTIGFLSQVSPDGQYVVTTLNESLYVSNFLDYRFLQVFYPTRGILGYYSRKSGQIKALPGADDPRYVHCDAVWSPDGNYVVFARAEAKDPYPEDGTLAAYPNDPAETQIRYDLWRIPFNGGRGGTPEPIEGASNNGMSNTFPKVSPDGKWIVFVQCRNGQLMRPDGKLWIVPASGGTARRMRCNTRLMNSWHSFSPNGRWMVFSSKANTPYTQMFLTHIDPEGNDSPAVLVPNSTAANRAVNIPEFVRVPYDQLLSITVPALDYLRHGLRGVQLAREGRLEEAMEEFERSVKINPEYLEGHVNAAVALLDKGMTQAAMTRLNAVLTLNPNRWDALGNVGIILARQGKLDEAITHFKKALEHNPNYAKGHANLGIALMEQGLFDQAAAHLRRAVKLDPKDPRSRFDLGSVLLAEGLPEEAVGHLEKAAEIDPGFVDARLLLAQALAAQGKFPIAAAQLQRAIAANPNNLRAVNDLAWLLAVCPQAEVRDGARALQLAQRACAVTARRDPVLLSTLAAAYAEQGNYPEAAAVAAAALRLVKSPNEFPGPRLRQQLEHYQDRRPYRGQDSVKK
ncbi:MAG TPA: tetratricopeptide repeat protein [Candidatus Anammoximicrobium sp.]|nr:tetratricopeptide repeat protein [Candidatus Anammoximicrobium sp.]